MTRSCFILKGTQADELERWQHDEKTDPQLTPTPLQDFDFKNAFHIQYADR